MYPEGPAAPCSEHAGLGVPNLARGCRKIGALIHMHPPRKRPPQCLKGSRLRLLNQIPAHNLFTKPLTCGRALLKPGHSTLP